MLSESENDQTLQMLLSKSATFRKLWQDMHESIEDTKFHLGETTQEHTRKVVSALRELSKDLPEAKRTLFELLGFLHDIGKPSTRKWNDEKGKVVFYGHDKAGKELAAKVLEEIAYENKDLLLSLIGHHMDIFQALNTKQFAFLAKDKRFPYIEELAYMAKADTLAINKDLSKEIDELVVKVKELRNSAK